MQEIFSRTEMLLGPEAMQRLAACRVAVFGVGGVGGYVVETLARSGVGAIDVVDNDLIAESNVNRQIIALTTNIGQPKVEVARERILAINPSCHVTMHKMFYLPANAHELDLSVYDYVVDCIDTVAAKMELVRQCKRLDVPIICSMGAANKLDSTAVKVADITHTRMDPLAKTLRKRLRREGINHFKCVYSPEVPRVPTSDEDGKRIPASVAWVPAAFGLALGSEVISDLVADCNGIAPRRHEDRL
ncbi:MAG: tRNA threonylcarbamoyladenosine dehydratase [Muribaculaceae bacterium]|nr:tRNA threonylcarbamoyladenosine dehydratase [Muribaculaceae bacterium]